jgi:hypothetical protein
MGERTLKEFTKFLSLKSRFVVIEKERNKHILIRERNGMGERRVW